MQFDVPFSDVPLSAVTVQPKATARHHGGFAITRPIEATTREQLLWAAIALQAVADQDPANVYMKGAEAARLRERQAEQSKAYVGSEDFEYVCVLAGVDSSLLKRMTPAAAREGLTRLLERPQQQDDPVPEVWDEAGDADEIEIEEGWQSL